MSNRVQIKEIRFPFQARTIEQIDEAVRVCPAWALNKFQVTYEGRTLGYEQARRLVEEQR